MCDGQNSLYVVMPWHLFTRPPIATHAPASSQQHPATPSSAQQRPATASKQHPAPHGAKRGLQRTQCTPQPPAPSIIQQHPASSSSTQQAAPSKQHPAGAWDVIAEQIANPCECLFGLWHARSYWRVQIEDKLYSLKWSCGVFPDWVDFRYRSGYRGVSLRASLQGQEILWSQGYVSSDTNSDKLHVAILLMDNGFGEAVCDRTTMFFQHISAWSPSESTSSTSPSPPSSSSSSPPSGSSSVLTKKGYREVSITNRV